jgi:hypothetical protein
LTAGSGTDSIDLTTYLCKECFPALICMILYHFNPNLVTIGVVVVDSEGSGDWALNFEVDNFMGRFRRVRVLFTITFVAFEFLVFPDLFKVIESGILPAETFLEGDCGG